jgi:glucokinase
LRRQYGHVSAERVLSGHGLEALYRAIASIDARTVPARNAAEITEAALNGDCAASRAAVDTFCAILGDVAGNFALGFGAQGGVFLAGGIITHLRDHLPHSRFRERFDAKGRMRRYVEAIPAYLILREDPSFIGLRALAAQHAM